MGSKRNKLKKALSPSNPSPPPPAEDDGLLDELYAQLDSKSPAVQSEAAVVLEQVKSNEAHELENDPKQDSRTRFEARQVVI